MPQLALSFALQELGPDPAQHAERAEAACFAAGALAVSYTDQCDEPILEPAPGEFRLWPHARLEALFPQEMPPLELLLQIATALDMPLGSIKLAMLQDRVWEREWLVDFGPMRFGRRLWIAPHESLLDSGDDAIVVRLDPGLAFGTGTHPTTALCLEWLDEHLVRDTSVIDYGCGSGILAIAAAKLGASDCQAFDIDPQALTATHDNAAANGVLPRIRIVAADDSLTGSAALLVANILAAPLVELAPRFAALVAPGGRLLLAGLLQHQAAEVIAAQAPWFDVRPYRQRDNWIALAARRR
ncbi:MAG: 50S ribosomal protein L11 methyltransferase [Pseudomonadales bacterium]|nr:50S ribosomal protein L11 methyltransferase [Pseudomonadales bacterium]